MVTIEADEEKEEDTMAREEEAIEIDTMEALIEMVVIEVVEEMETDKEDLNQLHTRVRELLFRGTNPC